MVENQVIIDRPLRAPLHAVDFFSLLDEEEAFNSRLLYLGDRLPNDVSRQVQRDVGEFLDDAIKMASFLGHRAMRVAVTMEVVLEINYKEDLPRRQMARGGEQQRELPPGLILYVFASLGISWE
ncbi:unnamed protein product [Spirodela intermedia]|uniref:Uncharacterized protein n=1 Tax=Spirodela intermedia TaxID=51605 RepID=A0ABN7EAL4_SPIIN|nr:unnamed protein product [Spirodela intermedia]